MVSFLPCRTHPVTGWIEWIPYERLCPCDDWKHVNIFLISMDVYLSALIKRLKQWKMYSGLILMCCKECLPFAESLRIRTMCDVTSGSGASQHVMSSTPYLHQTLPAPTTLLSSFKFALAHKLKGNFECKKTLRFPELWNIWMCQFPAERQGSLHEIVRIDRQNQRHHSGNSFIDCI